MPQRPHTKQNPHRFKLREAMTSQERILWRHLRDRFPAASFRRQMTLGPYIADFVSLPHNLVIELDGSQHLDNPTDLVRDAWMRDQGFNVLRVWNFEVTGSLEAVLERIYGAIAGGGTA